MVDTTGNKIGEMGGIIDRRTRIRAKPGMEDYVYGEIPKVVSGTDSANAAVGGGARGARDTTSAKELIMRLLHPGFGEGTNGLVFPYTPVIGYTQNVDYRPFDMVHVNSDYYAYAKTQTLQLTVTGTWTAQNPWEARYVLGAIHFLRTVTKMRFGFKDRDLAGTPPPILLFSSHGQYMFNDIPVVINNFTIDLPNDVDYVPVEIGGNNDLGDNIVQTFADVNNLLDPTGGSQHTSIVGKAWVPSRFTLSVNLIVQQTPEQWRKEFSWTSFRDGSLIKRGGWT